MNFERELNSGMANGGGIKSGDEEPVVAKEGPIAKAIERQTAKVPSDVFLWAATGAAAASLILQVSSGFTGTPTRRGQIGVFIGQWAPTLLLLGIYNKMVKQHGSDMQDAAQKQSAL